jgi:hypothetical protein
MTSKHLVLRGWSAWTGLAAIFMIHKFNVLLKTCITIGQKMVVSFNSFRAAVALEPPALGTHFSGLSLKKWSPSRAALA